MSELHFDAKDPQPPDPAARLRKHVQDRLHVLEKTGQCQVCNANEWALLNSSDVTTQITTTQLSGWPTYALACGKCGFVRHHLRSIFDGNVTLPSPGEHGSHLAGVPSDTVLEARVAVLGKIAASTEDLLAELRWDMKAVRSKQEEDYRLLADKMSGHSEKLSALAGGFTLRLYALGGLAVAGLLALVAKSLRWF